MADIITKLEKLLGVELQSVGKPDDLKYSVAKNTYCVDSKGQVTGLNLCEGKWTDGQLKEVWQLNTLQVLNVSGNQLTTITIPGDWEELKWLDVSDCETLEDLQFDKGLPALARLEVSDSGVKALHLPPGFQALEWLDISRNRLESVKMEGEYPELEWLDLSGNGKEEKPGFSKFTGPANTPKLIGVYLFGNKLQELEWSYGDLEKMTEEPHFRLDDNPWSDDALASNIGKGNAFPFLFQYFKDRSKGIEEDKEYKVMVLGNGQVGKSSMVDRLTFDSFEEGRDSTHAIRLVRFEKKDFPFILNFWDFGGQDIYHATHRLFLQKDVVYLLLWNKETEEKALRGEPTVLFEDGRSNEYTNHSLTYWMHYAVYFGKGSPVLIVQTCKLQNGDLTRNIPGEPRLETIHAGDFLKYVAIDSKEDSYKNGFEELELDLKNAIRSINRQGQKAANWMAARESVKERRNAIQEARNKDESSPYSETMTIVEFKKEILLPNKVHADPTYVLNWLMESGLVFFRPGLFDDQIIIDQEWAIQAIYTIFKRNGDVYYRFREHGGRFTGQDLSEIWSEYSTDEQLVFLNFMLSCELCFEITSEDKWKPFLERAFVAPQMLDEKKQPASFRVQRNAWEKLQSQDPFLHLKFHNDYIHYGIIQSFIVRSHSLASIEDIYQNGILLSWKGENAIVEFFPHQTILIQAPQSARDFMAFIIQELFSLMDAAWTVEFSQNGKTFEKVHLTEYSMEALSKALPAFSDNQEAELLTRGKAMEPSELKEEITSPSEQVNKRKLRVLFLTACPAGENPIHEDQEYWHVSNEVKETIELIPEREVTSDTLIDKSVEIDKYSGRQFNIIHFSGHGFEGDADKKQVAGLVFQNDGKNGKCILTSEQLRGMFEYIQGENPEIRCVLFNTCHSAEQAKAVSALGIPAIGMAGKLQSEAARKFSAGLYKEYEHSGDLRKAVKKGKAKGIAGDPDIIGIVRMYESGKEVSL